MVQFLRNILIIIVLIISHNSFSQHNFEMYNGVNKQSISFKLLSNLIVIPIDVNGKKLNFILDSGVGTTILFNINNIDSIQLKNTKKIRLQGLGSEDAVEAIASMGNDFKLKNIGSLNQKLYVISNSNFDLSSKMGLTIHGIIGYELLKDFAVKINYSTKKITFYKSETYEHVICKKCETFNLEFFKLKPYVNVGVRLNTSPNKIIPVKLLIDSGGSDAMWLFEDTLPEIVEPTNYFEDFLGEGLSGVIYGKRSIIDAIVIGKFELMQPTVSYPDSISTAHARRFIERNGSLGASILKRFIVTFDYKKQKVTFKRGGYFKKPFSYNKSGIELVYNGKRLVKDFKGTSINFNKSENISNRITLDYKFAFKNSYKIHKLRVGSPAYNAGLLVGDLIIKINGKYAHELKFEEIVGKFYQKENKKITLVVERNGKDYEYHLKLKDMLK